MQQLLIKNEVVSKITLKKALGTSGKLVQSEEEARVARLPDDAEG